MLHGLTFLRKILGTSMTLQYYVVSIRSMLAEEYFGRQSIIETVDFTILDVEHKVQAYPDSVVPEELINPQFSQLA